jgi:hypothetical protein
MKNIIKIFILIILGIGSVNAQTYNWAKVNQEDKHSLNINLGIRHGVNYGIGYGYLVNNKLFPIIINSEFSLPSGKDLNDDFKANTGIQIRWIAYNNFHFSTMLHGVFRRFENDMVRLVNFGSDFSGTAGYYRQKWFIATEVGFDKAIVTNFKPSPAYNEIYPGVTGGWYEPATGGNFYYLLQSGFSSTKGDIYIKAGKIITQDFKTKPLLPYVAQVGLNLRF